MAALPEEYLDRWPTIRVGHAWSLTFTHDHEGAKKELAQLERLAANWPPEGGSIRAEEMTQSAGMVGCVLNTFSEQPKVARDTALAWLRAWPDASAFKRGTVGNALAFACNGTFDFERGLQGLAPSSNAAALHTASRGRWRSKGCCMARPEH